MKYKVEDRDGDRRMEERRRGLCGEELKRERDGWRKGRDGKNRDRLI